VFAGHHCCMNTSATPAMLLAAGRGERMRPLTDICPKPLLQVQGKPLMQWPLEALALGGFNRVVVNTAWLGEHIEAKFGSVFYFEPLPNVRDKLSNKDHFPGSPAVHITYSHEGRDFGAALETAGGIARALPLLKGGGRRPADMGQSPPPPSLLGDVFWMLAGDVFAPDFVFTQSAVARFYASGKLAHLWLVPNPEHNAKGDFGLEPNTNALDEDASIGLALSLPPNSPQPRYTYSTIGLYRSALFAPPWCGIPAGNPGGVKAALAPLLRTAMAQHQVSAQLYTGRWTDVGTPQRLAQLNST
jgi:N-acetyl-alpha-D-muramate 1-phosphate uridylyltransferase